MSIIKHQKSRRILPQIIRHRPPQLFHRQNLTLQVDRLNPTFRTKPLIN
jgi:hypothetical protein